FNPSIAERICHKIYLHTLRLTASVHRKRLKRADFTIISNNCWAGICYEHYGLPKISPTVGAYFFADDYLKFCSDLKYYLGQELRFIQAKESKYASILMEREEMHVPVGVLDDVEIVFLHYKTPEIAKEKWERRVSRINWDNLIVKFSYQNGCTDAHIHQFFSLPLPGKRFAFVNRPFPEYPSAFVIEGYENNQIENDTFWWNQYFDVDGYLNKD
ncbi:MAG: DUF1919 domain-containing protein, partial [Anaerotignum sp.]|nr:DUF1919 domain-containing protein [Anaerotignum sp.]